MVVSDRNDLNMLKICPNFFHTFSTWTFDVRVMSANEVCGELGELWRKSKADRYDFPCQQA